MIEECLVRYMYYNSCKNLIIVVRFVGTMARPHSSTHVIFTALLAQHKGPLTLVWPFGHTELTTLKHVTLGEGGDPSYEHPLLTLPGWCGTFSPTPDGSTRGLLNEVVAVSPLGWLDPTGLRITLVESPPTSAGLLGPIPQQGYLVCKISTLMFAKLRRSAHIA